MSDGRERPEAVEQRIKEAVEQALAKSGHDLKSRELDMKERKTDAEIQQIMAYAKSTIGSLSPSVYANTHIKDGRLVDGKTQYTFLGQGDAPLAEAFDALKAGGYKGYYSFEWEKLWHPEIAEPELAFADYPKSIEKYF